MGQMDETRRSREQGSPRGPVLRIVLLYLLFGAAWILVTDSVLPRLVDDVGAWRTWQTYKGLVFVLLSAAVIGLLVHRELAARRRAERERERAEARYRVLFERNVAGVFRTRPEGEILDCNRALARLLGHESPDELIGTDARSHYAEPSDREEWIRRVREEGEIRNQEIRLRRPDGRPVWALMNAGLQEVEPGEGPVLAGTMVDVTERKRLRDQLEAYAYHDALTGLPNRRSLKREARAVLAKARRDDEMVGLLYLDLDRFTRINDTLGHDVGDRVLYEVGRRLERHVREEDVPARIGGDEFAVLLNTVEDEEGARTVARRLREAMGEPFRAGDRSVHLDLTVGVALFPEHGTQFQDLLSRADRAMSRARGRGTGVAVHVHVPRGDGASRDELAEEEDLRRALADGELELHYQPVVRVGDGRIVGAEALARWRHPELGMRSPADFIPLAERTGLIRALDRWAIGAAAVDARRLASAGPLEWLSVNVSPHSLEGGVDPGASLGVLEDAGGNGGRLVIEVTESGAMRDPEASRALFRELRARGVGVAIDDFGTGHSALAYLMDLPADIVKLDMIFVQGVGAGGREDRLLRALVELGQTLEVEVVGEGVETEGQLERLREYGCDLAQGYHLGRPAPLHDLERALRG